MARIAAHWSFMLWRARLCFVWRHLLPHARAPWRGGAVQDLAMRGQVAFSEKASGIEVCELA